MMRTPETHKQVVKPNWRRLIALALRALREASILSDSLVLLVGSYARGVARPESDVDLLVLVPDLPATRPRLPAGIHLHFERLADVPKRLREGDDYLIAALRYGAAVYDRSHRVRQLRGLLAEAGWPDWRKKLDQARRRLAIADSLLEARDADAAAEEYLVAASHLSRAALLRAGTYPLARPELAGQLRQIGHDRLAEALESLIHGAVAERELRTAASHLRDVLAGGLSGDGAPGPGLRPSTSPSGSIPPS